ncbi:MAG: PEP/pyruvate-binding domain-containing protein, partial [Anaerolineales bacterium]
ANLARLTRAGFTVPRGFIISTEAYREFVSANRWLATIQSVVQNLSAEDASALEKASAQIHMAFVVGKIPNETVSATRAARRFWDDKWRATSNSSSFKSLTFTNLVVLSKNKGSQLTYECPIQHKWQQYRQPFLITEGFDIHPTNH